MDRQAELHEESWNQRKPTDDAVRAKPRIEYTISALDDLVQDGDQVFDLGCGNGIVGEVIQRQNETIVVDGCDISSEAVSRAQERYREVHHLNVDNEELPVDDDSYTVIVCTDVLEHLLDPQHALSEIERALEPKGIAVISVPNYGYLRYRLNSVRGELPSILDDERHFQAYTIDSLQTLAHDAGLELVEVDGVGRWPQLAIRWPSLFAKTIVFRFRPSF